MEAWINGAFKSWDQANVSILSHSFGRGSAIFEVFDMASTPKGPAFFGIEEHIDRLLTSAELVYMQLPMTKEEIIAACVETARRNNVSHGATKLFAYYHGVEFDVYPSNPEVHVAIFCIDYDAFGIKREDLAVPVDVGVSAFKKLHPATMPIHAKVCGSYVIGYLATAEVRSRGYDDVINVDLNGHVAESAAASLFFVKAGVLNTSRIDNVLKGITRSAVIDIAGDLGIEVLETDIPVQALESFDEAFFAVSIKRIQPIRSIDRTTLGKECPGALTRRISDAVDGIYSGDNPQFTKWLTYY